MSTGITAVMMAHNIVKYNIPLIYSAESVLPVVDQLIVVLCEPNDDGTNQVFWDFHNQHKDKVEVMFSKWPEKSDWLSGIVNHASTYATGDWVWEVQDEVLDESQYPLFESIKDLPDDVMAVRTKFIHPLGDFYNEWDFCYKSAIRMFRTISDWHFTGDAAEAVGSGKVYDSDIIMFHLGKVDAPGRLEKEYDFQDQLYRGKEQSNPVFRSGGIDPKLEAAHKGDVISYHQVFEQAYKDKLVRPYKGIIPYWADKWAKDLNLYAYWQAIDDELKERDEKLHFETRLFKEVR